MKAVMSFPSANSAAKHIGVTHRSVLNWLRGNAIRHKYNIQTIEQEISCPS